MATFARQKGLGIGAFFMRDRSVTLTVDGATVAFSGLLRRWVSPLVRSSWRSTTSALSR